MHPVDEVLELLRKGEIVSGLANCHVLGAYSVVLRPRFDEFKGMLRLFYVGYACKLNQLFQGDDFVVMPHNHRQDVTLYQLFGDVHNVRALFGDGGMPVYEYQFKSAIADGDLGVERRGVERSALFHFEKLDRSGIEMAWWNHHTMVAQPNSAWIVDEGKLAPADKPPFCYSTRPDKKLDSTGLYRKMTGVELVSLRARITSEIANAK